MECCKTSPCCTEFFGIVYERGMLKKNGKKRFDCRMKLNFQNDDNLNITEAAKEEFCIP